jgi:prolyl oligopeptidase
VGRVLITLAWVTATGLVSCRPAEGEVPRPPAAPVQNVVDVHYGVRVDDPYRYMESPDDPKVAEWLKAQSIYTRARLDQLSGRVGLLRRVEEIEAAASAELRRVAWLINDRVFYLKREPNEARSKLYMRDGLAGKERLLVDADVRGDRTLNPALHFYSPSGTGRYVAYGIAQGGSEVVAMSVLDTATGKVLGPLKATANASANVIAPRSVWGGDEVAYYFNQKVELRPGMPLTEKYMNSTVFAYRTSAPDTSPKPVFGNQTKAAPRLEPDELPFVEILPASEYALGVSLLELRSLVSLYLVRQSDLQRPVIPWRRIVSFDDQARAYAVHGDDLYLITEKGAPRFKVIKTSLADPDLRKPTEVVSESEAVVAEIAAAADALYVRLLDGGPSRLMRVDYKTHRAQEIPMPFSGSARIAYADVRRAGVVLEIAGWTRARAMYAYDPSKSRMTPLPLQSLGPFDAPGGLVVRAVKVPSRDGVLIPLTIIHKEDLPPNGNNAAILTGYGAYGYSFEPYFDPRWLAWLERGGIYAIANVRGGGEYGRDWHRAGFQATKPNTWRDVIACAEYLVAQRYTSPKRLGLLGGSAGGILAGRAMTERPDLFAAVVANVGLLDAIRAETGPTGPGNTREFGSVKNDAGFRGLLAMSTYHHVTAGEAYPAAMFLHGMNDPRVPAWHSAKTAARLQAATTSARPVLLRLDYQAGHGIGSSAVQLREQFVDTLAFMLWQFGDPTFQPTSARQ